MSNFDVFAHFAHAAGRSPIDHISDRVTQQLEIQDMVREARARDSKAFAAYTQDMSVEALAAKIVGLFISSGWDPPDLDAGDRYEGKLESEMTPDEYADASYRAAKDTGLI